ncbi:Dicer-like protein 1 [Actinomortierella wolfii]|nr:Dicer-like protein 1 [Actinomortierella wolfii]
MEERDLISFDDDPVVYTPPPSSQPLPPLVPLPLPLPVPKVQPSPIPREKISVPAAPIPEDTLPVQVPGEYAPTPATATTTAATTTTTTTTTPFITTATKTTTTNGAISVSPLSYASHASSYLADLDAAALTPRTYQYKLFALAKEQNIIAVMNTGTGKTLVAAMLINEILAREAERTQQQQQQQPAPVPAKAGNNETPLVSLDDNEAPLVSLDNNETPLVSLDNNEASLVSLNDNEPPVTPPNKRLCFFVVNSVPLVFQQAAVIRTQCGAHVEAYCGDMRTGYLSKAHWERIMPHAEVIVLTAQILADVFQHGFLKMSNVALLIFDECHHARNDHPYHNIMRNYYHTAPKEIRPKVFGMTASPSSGSAAHLAWCARELELNLDATIYTADADTVRLFVPQPKEVILYYYRYPITHLVSEFMRKYDISDMSNGVNTFNVMSTVLSNLGPWCMARLLQKQMELAIDLQDLELDIYPKNNHDCGDDPAYMLTPATPSSEPWRLPPIFPQRRPRLSVEDMSPKAMKLIQLLWVTYKKFQDEFCGIIFVERRYAAYAVGELLRELEIFQGIFRVGLLVGHGGGKKGKDRSVRMMFNEQNRVITDFRNGTYNLLVATKVAEEGLDIPSCNVVVRYDPVDSAISYIQSRGRARQHQSLFVLFLEHENRKSEAAMERLVGEVRNMEVWSKQLEEGKAPKVPSDMDKDIPRRGTRYMHTYVVESTGAKLTMESSIALIYHYCSKLRADEFTVLRPEFEISATGTSGFICQVTLPSVAPIRRVESDIASTKTMAKRSAAFKACEQLHILGALNDHLMPVVENPKPVQPPQGTTTSSSKRGRGGVGGEEGGITSQEYPFKVPSFWAPFKIDLLENTVILYASIFRLSDKDQQDPLFETIRPLCMLTVQPLPTAPPPIQLFVDGRERTVVVHRVSSSVQLSVDDVDQLRRFTTTLFSRVSRRKYECDLARLTYVLAPLHADGPFTHSTQDHPKALVRDDLAWAEVEALVNSQSNLMPLTDEELQVLTPESFDTLLTMKNNKSADYTVKTILPHVTLDSKMCEVDLKAYAEEHIRKKLKKNAAAAEAGTNGDGSNDKATTTTTITTTSTDASGDDPTLLTVGEYLRERYLLQEPIEGRIAILERTKRFRNHLQPIVQTIEKSEISQTLVCALGQCLRVPIAASVLRAFALIPSTMVRLDAYLSAYELQEKLGLTEIPVETMLTALTTPSANMAMQYERLELLGDSFLKFSCTIRLYIVNPAKDEGQLHASRIQIVSNHALLQHALQLEIHNHVASIPFHRKAWRPVGFSADGETWEEFAAKNFKHTLSNKTLADIVEATLGAAFLTGGTELGLKAAKALLVPFPEFEHWWSFSQVHQPPALHESLIERNRVNIEGAEATLGYKFKNPMYFLEAMTHASTLRVDSICYQRLEFLGDAVLDFQVVRQYSEEHPESDPGTIVVAKDNSVSNRILGALAIELGLYRYLDQSSAGLMTTVANAVVAVEAFKAEQAQKRAQKRRELLDMDVVGNNTRSGSPEVAMPLTREEQEEEFDFWLNISMPKVLGDLVESTIGAVFVDSGFDYEVVSDLFHRLVWPYIKRHVTFEDVAVHPTKALLELLQSYGCTNFSYTTKEAAHQPAMVMASPVVEISFRMHNQILATLQSPYSEQCKKETSAEVLRLLKVNRGLLDQICTCKKRGKKGSKA